MIKALSKPNKKDSYWKLVERRPLISIRTEAELDAAQTFVDQLLTRELDEGGQAYLETLSDLILVYEQDHHAIEPLPPDELLEQLITEHQMTQADLVRKTGIAKATVSDLVTGKRAFTVEQMQLIATVFHLPAWVFLPKAASASKAKLLMGTKS